MRVNDASPSAAGNSLLQPFGKPRQKNHIKIIDVLAVKVTPHLLLLARGCTGNRIGDGAARVTRNKPGFCVYSYIHEQVGRLNSPPILLPFL
ncbi:hypothetical protein HO173_010650 [Letharia columbiana]|uniref:Uncharacterized protein n=1 Tax=Letharia columbiana TaxID=112416 RepID=A0A8H6L0M2_9LECA|nr:uncharacterized protein HO173_010650 [Letharia columbiana]KAF6231150.1 hypothetical protein HO173_010650 [Letharia columbiana]